MYIQFLCSNIYTSVLLCRNTQIKDAFVNRSFTGLWNISSVTIIRTPDPPQHIIVILTIYLITFQSFSQLQQEHTLSVVFNTLIQFEFGYATTSHL